jgi:hypothetical protein
MRLIGGAALVLAVVMQCGCDLAELAGVSAGQLEAKAQTSIRPYFPRALVKMDPGTDQLVVVTCADNIGEQLLHEIAPKVMEMPNVQMLRSVHRSRWGTAAAQLAGVRLPRLLSLAFDHSMLVLDTANDRYYVSSNLPPAYFQAYRQGCPNSPAASPATATRDSNAHVWVGVFEITYEDETGKRQSITGTDSLGMYRSDIEFGMQQEAEIAARRALIEKQLVRDGLRAVSIELLRIEKLGLMPTAPQ